MIEGQRFGLAPSLRIVITRRQRAEKNIVTKTNGKLLEFRLKGTSLAKPQQLGRGLLNIYLANAGLRGQ